MFKSPSFISKRTILSIIITVVFLILSSKYWLIIRHLPEKTSIKFEFLIFVILLVLIYLLAYKLTDYMANFKTIQDKSRIDIGFLAIFFTFLAIPMCHISNEVMSNQENRKLADWKPLISEKGDINFNFGKDFDAYFSDRFFLREPVTFIYKKIKIALSYKVIEINNIYYNKKTGWAFMRVWFEVADITPNMPAITTSIQKLYDFCNKNGIKLYIIVAPVKEEVYSDKIHPFALRQQNGKIFTDMINKNIANIAYFPIDLLKEKSKTEYTYPKTDPHWSELGGFITANNFLKHFGYKQLNEDEFNIIDKTHPVITDIPDWMTDKSVGYYYQVLGLKNKQNYKNFTHKFEDELVILKKDDLLFSKDSHFEKAKNPQKVYIIGSSYCENVYRFLRFAFKDIQKRRINNNVSNGEKIPFNRWQSEILETKPDILLLIIESTSLHKYTSLWDN